MKHVLLVFSFTIILFSHINPQVKIKEKIEIQPQIILSKYLNTANEHIFKYTFTWSPSEDCRGNIKIITCSGETLNSGWTNSGSTTISFIGNGRHHYEFQSERWTYNLYTGKWEWRWDVLPNQLLQVFIDGIDQNHPQNVIGHYAGVSGDFNFQISGSVCPDDYASLSIKDKQWAECDGPNWYFTDPVLIQIVEGNEYAFLYDKTSETALGDYVQLNNYNEIQNIILKRKEPPPITNISQTIKLEVNINEVVQYDSIILSPTSPILIAALEYDVILNNQTTELYLTLYSESGCPLPEDYKFTASIIHGGQYGELVDTAMYTGGSGARGQYLEILNQWGCCLIMTYDANGILPTTKDSIVIEFGSTVEGSEPQYLTINIVPAIRVTLAPSDISPGDTADIKLEKWNPDLEIFESFTAGQKFEIGITEQCDFGELLASDGNRNNYFAGIEEPVKFIAADSLDQDSIVVKIKAGIFNGVSSAGQMNITDNKTLNKTGIKTEKDITVSQKEKLFFEKIKCIPEAVKQRMITLMKKKQTTNKTSSAISKPQGIACAIINSEENGEGEVMVIKPEIEILYPTKDSPDEMITVEPKMPDVICKARMKNYQKGLVKYEWEYWISYEMNRYTYDKNKFKISLCSRFGKTIISGKSYSYNEQESNWLVPFNKDSATFNFKAISHRNRNIPGYGCEKEIDSWYEGDDIFTGGNIFVQVTAKDKNGKQIGFKQISANNLLGQNQADLNTIYEYADSKEIEAILRHESRTRQFNEFSWPIYGYPNGYGLMQLDDPAASEKQMWNWRENLDGGKNLYFNEKKPSAERFLKKHGYTTEELLKCSFQKYNYNKNFYYEWDKDSQKWKKRSDLPNDYGGEVYEIYLTL